MLRVSTCSLKKLDDDDDDDERLNVNLARYSRPVVSDQISVTSSLKQVSQN